MEACNDVTQNSNADELEMKVGSLNKNLGCEICHKQFPSKPYLAKHLLHHKGGKKPHICEICKKAFILKINLKKHIENFHSKEVHKENNNTISNSQMTNKNDMYYDGKVSIQYPSDIAEITDTDNASENEVLIDVDVKIPENNPMRTNSSDKIRTKDDSPSRANCEEKSNSCPFCNKCFPHLVTLERHIDKLHSDVYYQLDGTRGNTKSVVAEVQADIGKQESMDRIKHPTKSGDSKLETDDSKIEAGDLKMEPGDLKETLISKSECCDSNSNPEIKHSINLPVKTSIKKMSKPFTCSLCGFKFKNRDLFSFKRHMKRKHREVSYDNLDLIIMKHNNKENKLAQHQKHRINIIKSEHKKYSLQESKTIPHKKKGFLCFVCEGIFFKLDSLEKHLTMHVVSGETTEAEMDIKFRKLHMETMHNLINGKTEKVDIISKEEKNDVTNTKKVIQKSITTKKFQCDICNSGFNYKNNLYRHKRIIHNKKLENKSPNTPEKDSEKVNVDTEKSRNIQNKDIISKEEKIDVTNIEKVKSEKIDIISNEEKDEVTNKTMVIQKGITTKKFQCNICNNGFKYKNNLYRHKRSSHNIKYEKKIHGILDKETKKVHLDSEKSENNQEVNKQKQFQCGFCKKSFGYIKNLINHKQIKHPSKENVTKYLDTSTMECKEEELGHQNPDSSLELENGVLEKTIDIPSKKYFNNDSMMVKETFEIEKHKKNLKPEINTGSKDSINYSKTEKIILKGKQKSFSCDLCTCKFKYKHNLKRHKQGKHIPEKYEDRGDTLVDKSFILVLCCFVCQEKFEKMNLFRQHVFKHILNKETLLTEEEMISQLLKVKPIKIIKEKDISISHENKLELDELNQIKNVKNIETEVLTKGNNRKCSEVEIQNNEETVSSFSVKKQNMQNVNSLNRVPKRPLQLFEVEEGKVKNETNLVSKEQDKENGREIEKNSPTLEILTTCGNKLNKDIEDICPPPKKIKSEDIKVEYKPVLKSKETQLFTCFVCNQVFDTFSRLKPHVFIHVALNETSQLKMTSNLKTDQELNDIKMIEERSQRQLVKQEALEKKKLLQKSKKKSSLKVSSPSKNFLNLLKVDQTRKTPLEKYKKIIDKSKNNISFQKKKLKLKTKTKKVKHLQWTCTICSQNLSTKTNLRIHMKNVHDSEVKICGICTEIFESEEQYEKHLNEHAKQKSFLCDVCNTGFDYFHSLKRHKEKKHAMVEESHTIRYEENNSASDQILPTETSTQLSELSPSEVSSSDFAGPENVKNETLKANSLSSSDVPQISQNSPSKIFHTCLVCQMKFQELSDIKKHVFKHVINKEIREVDMIHKIVIESSSQLVKLSSPLESISNLPIDMSKSLDSKPQSVTKDVKNETLKANTSLSSDVPGVSQNSTSETCHTCLVCQKKFQDISTIKRHVFKHVINKEIKEEDMIHMIIIRKPNLLRSGSHETEKNSKISDPTTLTEKANIEETSTFQNIPKMSPQKMDIMTSVKTGDNLQHLVTSPHKVLSLENENDIQHSPSSPQKITNKISQECSAIPLKEAITASNQIETTNSQIKTFQAISNQSLQSNKIKSSSPQASQSQNVEGHIPNSSSLLSQTSQEKDPSSTQALKVETSNLQQQTFEAKVTNQLTSEIEYISQKSETSTKKILDVDQTEIEANGFISILRETKHSHENDENWITNNHDNKKNESSNKTDSSITKLTEESGVSKFSCFVCSSSYIKFDELKRHLFYHVIQRELSEQDMREKLLKLCKPTPSSTNSFSCTKCDKTFNLKIKLNKHIQNKHKEEEKTEEESDMENKNRKVLTLPDNLDVEFKKISTKSQKSTVPSMRKINPKAQLLW